MHWQRIVMWICMMDGMLKNFDKITCADYSILNKQAGKITGLQNNHTTTSTPLNWSASGCPPGLYRCVSFSYHDLCPWIIRLL